jgi:hypothetical protein
MSATRNHRVDSGGKESTPRKATLFCPVCGHAAHPTAGDWAVTERSVGGVRQRAYECPECWHTVLVQPMYAGSVPA